MHADLHAADVRVHPHRWTPACVHGRTLASSASAWAAGAGSPRRKMRASDAIWAEVRAFEENAAHVRARVGSPPRRQTGQTAGKESREEPVVTQAWVRENDVDLLVGENKQGTFATLRAKLA